MALQGWRLFGVSVTIALYIGGVLFLSINNVPGPQRRKMRFAEFSNSRNQRISSFNRKMSIRWCKKLKFLTEDLPEQTTETLTSLSSESTQQASLQSTNCIKSTGLTALASFPGSGNTWLRYLLQQSTGVLTGSIYKDYGLLKTGFPAENICNKSVLIVKTHEWGPHAWQAFTKAILLVRDPEKAILAEFNRQSGGHVGFASPDRYKRTKGKYWMEFVAKKLHGWETMNLSWARNFNGSLKVVFYDDLVNKLEVVLREILHFLEFPVDETNLKCALVRKEGIFRRKKRFLSFDPYTSLMRKQIEEKKKRVYSILQRH